MNKKDMLNKYNNGNNKDADGMALFDLLQAAEMEEVLVLAGTGGLYRQVSRANIYADEEILDWVSPGELLLITEVRLRDWDDEKWISLLQHCERLGLSAIGLKYNNPNPPIPQAAVVTANQLNLPLLLLPREMAVAEFNSIVFKYIFAKQQAILQYYQKLNEALQRCLLEEGGVSAALELLEHSLNLPLVFIADDWRQPQLHTAGRDELAAALKQDAQLFMQSTTLSKRTEQSETQLDKLRVWRTVVPVSNKNWQYGCLLVWSLEAKLDHISLGVVEAVASHIAVLMMQDYALREVELKHSSEFIDGLLSDSRKELDPERAAIHKLNIQDDYCVLLLRFILCSEEYHGDTPDLQTFICANIRWVQSLMKKHKIHGLIMQHGNYLGILIASSSTDKRAISREQLTLFAEDLVQDFKARMRSTVMQCKVGIGRFHATLSQMSRSYKEAEDALMVGRQFFAKDILFFEDLGIFRIMVQSSLREEIGLFVHEVLDDLLRYDEKKGTQLTKTLEIYFKNNTNVNKTSEELFTHYNTVLYRLGRIEEISGKNLADSNDRLNLELALKLNKIYPLKSAEQINHAWKSEETDSS